jgi:hypothetical protein
MIWKKKGRVKSGSMVVRLATKKRKSHSKIKIMLIGFLGGDIRGVVYHEFVPQGSTLMAHFMWKF